MQPGGSCCRDTARPHGKHLMAKSCVGVLLIGLLVLTGLQWLEKAGKALHDIDLAAFLRADRAGGGRRIGAVSRGCAADRHVRRPGAHRAAVAGAGAEGSLLRGADRAAARLGVAGRVSRRRRRAALVRIVCCESMCCMTAHSG